LWRDGAPWIAHNGDPLSGYQTQFDIDRFQGLQPLSPSFR
jgi:hypothetical protein